MGKWSLACRMGQYPFWVWYLGVAAGADSVNAVVLAGATGAIVASVSMMAGCFMQIESQRDEEERE